MSRPLIVALSLVSAPAFAGPTVDSLLCKRTLPNDNNPTVVLGVKGEDTASLANPDGSRTVRSAPGEKRGFEIVDVKTGKARAVHNKNKDYDCDMAENEGKANSVRWLGNDVVFAQGWWCEEFAAKPYLANGKTGKFIGAVKLPSVTPETVYHFAPLDGALWAASVFEHNSSWNAVVVIDTKTAKIKSTKKLDAAAIAKLPDCSAE